MPSIDEHRLSEPATGGYAHTPDGRYFIVKGRLWRLANPTLDPQRREELIRELMAARRALRGLSPDVDRVVLRRTVDDTKVALGERGPVWWTDGAPDYNRRLVKNTPYATWYAAHEANTDAGS